jgi:hypothetical protein
MTILTAFGENLAVLLGVFLFFSGVLVPYNSSVLCNNDITHLSFFRGFAFRNSFLARSLWRRNNSTIRFFVIFITFVSGAFQSNILVAFVIGFSLSDRLIVITSIIIGFVFRVNQLSIQKFELVRIEIFLKQFSALNHHGSIMYPFLFNFIAVKKLNVFFQAQEPLAFHVLFYLPRNSI